jgi:hypothetical protein
MLQAKSQPIIIMTGIQKKTGACQGEMASSSDSLGLPSFPYLNFVKYVRIQIPLRSPKTFYMKVLTNLFYITKHVHSLNNKIRMKTFNIQMACQTFPIKSCNGLDGKLQ